MIQRHNDRTHPASPTRAIEAEPLEVDVISSLKIVYRSAEILDPLDDIVAVGPGVAGPCAIEANVPLVRSHDDGVDDGSAAHDNKVDDGHLQYITGVLSYSDTRRIVGNNLVRRLGVPRQEQVRDDTLITVRRIKADGFLLPMSVFFVHSFSTRVQVLAVVVIEVPIDLEDLVRYRRNLFGFRTRHRFPQYRHRLRLVVVVNQSKTIGF